MSGHHHDHDHGQGALTTRALLVTLRVNILLMALKWAAFLVTRSSSLFAEAMHSTADTLNPFLLHVGDRLGRRDACARHPQGHVRERLFWSLVAAIGMFAIGGCWNAYHGVDALLSGHRPDYSPWALGIMALALALETRSLVASLRAVGADGRRNAWRAMLRSRNMAALAVTLENFADILGVVLALAGFGLYLLTGNPVWDAAFSILIAAMLLTSSGFLINRNRSLITGEAADENVPELVRDLIGDRGCAEVVEVTATVIGAHQTDIVVRLRWRERWFADRYDRAASRFSGRTPIPWTVRRLAQEREYVEHAVRENVPDAASVLVIAE